MKRFKTQQTYFALIMLILSVFLITGCGGHGGETNKWLPSAAPTVGSTGPVDVATEVCVNNTVTATFSKAMDPATINSDPAGTLLTFTLRETVSGINVPGTVAMNSPTNTIATFTPTAYLTVGLNYTATITTAAKDSDGVALAANKVWSFTAGACISAPPAPSVDLGAASTFGIASTAGVTNTITSPITHIEGDVVLAAPTPTCNYVTTIGAAGGFGLCDGMPPTINGTVITPNYDPGGNLATIKADLNAAYLSITPPAGPPAAGSLGGATSIAAGTTLGAVTGSALVPGDNLFTPGVYQSLTSIMITGDLTLDAQGDTNARFVFQSSSTVGMAAGAAPPGVRSRILLVGGAKASNVWWQAGSSATLGLYSEFQGNILAAFDITMETGATSCGRLMAGAWVGGSGAFVFDSNVVSVPGQPFAPPAGYSTTCE